MTLRHSGFGKPATMNRPSFAIHRSNVRTQLISLGRVVHELLGFSHRTSILFHFVSRSFTPSFRIDIDFSFFYAVVSISLRVCPVPITTQDTSSCDSFYHFPPSIWTHTCILPKVSISRIPGPSFICSPRLLFWSLFSSMGTRCI